MERGGGGGVGGGGGGQPGGGGGTAYLKVTTKLPPPFSLTAHYFWELKTNHRSLKSNSLNANFLNFSIKHLYINNFMYFTTFSEVKHILQV